MPVKHISWYMCQIEFSFFTHGSGQIVNLMEDYWHSSVCEWWSFNLQNPNWFDVEMPWHWPQESIPVRCVPSACKPYEFQWPPPDVTPEGRGRELKWTILNRFPGLQCWPPDMLLRGPQINKFVQVSSDDHKMSLPRKGPRSKIRPGCCSIKFACHFSIYLNISSDFFLFLYVIFWHVCFPLS